MNTSASLDFLEKCYAEAKYDECLNILDSKKNEISETLYQVYKGTVLIKQGQLALGRWNLEQAKANGEESILLNNNLSFVKKQIKAEYLEVNRSYFDAALFNLSGQSIYFFMIFGWVILFAIWFAWYKKFHRFILLTFIFAFFGYLSGIYFFKRDIYSGIAINNLSVLDGPSSAFEQVNEVPLGIKLVVEKNREGWFFIKAPQSYQGWIKASDLKLIK